MKLVRFPETKASCGTENEQRMSRSIYYQLNVFTFIKAPLHMRSQGLLVMASTCTSLAIIMHLNKTDEISLRSGFVSVWLYTVFL